MSDEPKRKRVRIEKHKSGADGDDYSFVSDEAQTYFNCYLKDWKNNSEMFKLQKLRRFVMRDQKCSCDEADDHLVKSGHFAFTQGIYDISCPRLGNLFSLLLRYTIEDADLLHIATVDPTLMSPSPNEFKYLHAKNGYIKMGLLRHCIEKKRMGFLTSVLSNKLLRPFALQGLATIRDLYISQPSLPIFEAVSFEREPDSNSPHHTKMADVLRFLIEEQKYDVNTSLGGWNLPTELFFRTPSHENTLELLRVLHEKGADLNKQSRNTRIFTGLRSALSLLQLHTITAAAQSHIIPPSKKRTNYLLDTKWGQGA